MFVKTFDHVEFPTHLYKKAERVETESMRLYRTPEGNLYPSVTSVLGHRPHPELDAWRAAVGEEEAKRVGEAASKRGSLLHDVAEDYLNNRLVIKKTNPFILQDFLPIKNVLDEHVNNIFSTELQLYSDKLKSAGTTDLVAEYDSKLSLLDFKTSRRVKYKQDIEDYFLQTTAYCCMMFEMFGITINDIVIIMMIDGDPKASVFHEKTSNYIKPYLKARKEFEREYKI